MNVINQEVNERFALYHADCIEVLRAIPSNSLDFSVYSPPFSSLFTYSNSDHDFGNCKDDEEFFTQYSFMTAELYRAMKPGRLVAVHCMNLPTSKERDGYIGIRDFRGDLIRLHQADGFIYHSEVTIWKDPVQAMQRTKALGLLHKQLRKDSAMSRQGIPDYLVVFRKPGENPDPVNHYRDYDEMVNASKGKEITEEERNKIFPVSAWQQYASPVWMDINPLDTLQKESAREAKDERHIAPLQLGVIRRAIKLWTNAGDTVFSPFLGIGSEIYVALQLGRKGIGAELKGSYFSQAVLNCKRAIIESSQQDFSGLFDADEEEDLIAV